jgi:DNA-binding transcriptional MocR family regulator
VTPATSSTDSNSSDIRRRTFYGSHCPGEARADQVAVALVRETVSVSTADPFATTNNPPHAIRLALGSVDIDVLAQSLDKVKRVIDDHTY